MVSSPQLTCSELERADKTLNACCVCNPHKLGDDIHNQRINRYPNNCKSQKYLGRNFFLVLSFLQIPCLIRFIVQVLSNFFERVLYNVAKLLVIACNSHNLEADVHNQRINRYSKQLHRGAFCQFLFRWIYYYHSSIPPKSKLVKRTSVNRKVHIF